jgi:hypothetical protein
MERMMSFCGSKMEMMSSFLKQMGSGREQTGSPEKE